MDAHDGPDAPRASDTGPESGKGDARALESGLQDAGDAGASDSAPMVDGATEADSTAPPPPPEDGGSLDAPPKDAEKTHDSSQTDKDAGDASHEDASRGDAGHADAVSPPATTYAKLASTAWKTVATSFYDATTSRWHVCLPISTCGENNKDWGADTMTALVWLHWKLTQDSDAVTMLKDLVNTSPTYTPTSSSWSDIPEWDSIAASEEYQATDSATALAKAKSAFAFVDSSTSFAVGACPSIDFQQDSASSKVKTLETDANYVKAAVLLYQETNDATYLTKAKTKYAAIRTYFLDPQVPLYTVYVIDDQTTCTQVRAQFFGSVNGIMIDNGLSLATLTGVTSYHDDAIATAQAVQGSLGDANGIYADLQASNDTSEPLIEAMYHLATTDNQAFAKTWLLASASAAGADSAAQGTYGRFFDGPAPTGTSDEWQTSGGLGLEMVAGALVPTEGPADPTYWSDATYVTDDIEVTTTAASFTFTGEAVAIVGTVGEQCCEDGHANVFVDGKQTSDQMGIWQNKNSVGTATPNQILFAWRWPSSGMHAIRIEPGLTDAKEGGSFFHMVGYNRK